MTRYHCDRCGKEMLYIANTASFQVFHEKNNLSFSITVAVSIINHNSGQTHMCEPCVKRLIWSAVTMDGEPKE
jgi:hypothetical protein